MKKATTKKFLSLGFAGFSLLLAFGATAEINAQRGRDPFIKNPLLRKKNTNVRSAGSPTVNNSNIHSNNSSTSSTPRVSKPTGPMPVDAPSAEARISYFKQAREMAAINGEEIPKVTTVMLLDELVVTGIFKSPRGYAAMVKAVPIDLSYTVYPGERFFDGQLVAVEEHRLIFRKVTKWTNGKFISSVEAKPLRTYTDQQTIQGTAPSSSSRRSSAALKNSQKRESQIVSPLDEMKNQPEEKPTDSAKNKKGKPRKSSGSGSNN